MPWSMQMESSKRKGVFLFSAGGRCLGRIRVSGADSATDEECAQLGIDAVADDLEFAE